MDRKKILYDKLTELRNKDRVKVIKKRKMQVTTFFITCKVHTFDLKISTLYNGGGVFEKEFKDMYISHCIKTILLYAEN